MSRMVPHVRTHVDAISSSTEEDIHMETISSAISTQEISQKMTKYQDLAEIMKRRVSRVYKEMFEAHGGNSKMTKSQDVMEQQRIKVCAKKCNNPMAPWTHGEILEKWLSIKNMSNGQCLKKWLSMKIESDGRTKPQESGKCYSPTTHGEISKMTKC
jgi:hypothetical protein